MGFLSGVLSNIKDHLGQHKNEIDIAITSLETNKHAGKKGFNDAIGRVVEGVGRYNKEVKKSNDDIKNPMKKLIKNIGSEFTDEVKLMLPESDHDDGKKVKAAETCITQKLEQCKNFATEFNDALNATTKPEIKKAIDDLNSNLAVTVRNALKAVSHESNRLDELSEREHKNLEATTAIITKVLNGLKVGVIDKINRELNNVFRLLTEKATNILEQLNKISESLQGYIKALKEWMETAERLIEAAEKRVKEISDEVTEKSNQNPAKWKGIEDTADEINSALDGKVQALEAWNTAASSVVSKAKEKCRDILGKVKNGNDVKSTVIYKQAQDLKTKATRLLQAYQTAHGTIENLPLNINGALGELENKIQEDLHRIKGEIKGDLKKVIGALHSGINAAKGDDTRANTFIQYFYPGMGEKDAAPKLRGWAEQASRVGTLHDAFQDLHSDVGFFEIFKKILAQLGVDQNTGGTFYKALNDDLDGKVDGRMPESGMKVKLSILKNYEKERDNKTGGKSRYQQVLEYAPQALDAFKDMSEFTEYQQDLRQGHIERAKNSLNTQVDNIENELEQIAGIVDSDKKDPPVPTPKTGVKNYLEDVTGMLGSEQLNLTSDIGKQQQSVQGLAKIKDEIRDLKDKIAVVKIKVGGLCDTIKVSAHFANGQLVTLKTHNIKAKLEAIKNQLHTLQSADLTKVISHTENLLMDIRDMQRNTIKDIIGYIEEQIEIAETSLDTHARKQYVCAVKSLLSEFANKVKSELEGLPEKIENDMDIGHKGFMKKLGGKFIERLQRIAQVDPNTFTESESPLNQAAKRFDGALSYFVIEFKNQTDFKDDMGKIRPTQKALETLLRSVDYSKHFNEKFVENLQALKKALSECVPQKFGDGKSPLLLEVLLNGFAALIAELEKTYVSTYSGRQYVDGDKDKYAKVFLTGFYILHENLSPFNKKCMRGGEWENKRCCEMEKGKENPLGAYLKRCGFNVAANEDSKDSELRHPAKDFNGKFIHERLLLLKFTAADVAKHLKNCESNTYKKPSQFELFDLLECLLYHTDKYNAVRHSVPPPKPRYPCNIFEMLVWCSGLQYNAAHDALVHDIFVELLTDPKKKKQADAKQGLDVPFTDTSALSIDAYPQAITYNGVVKSFNELCSTSYDVLVSVLGHGHSGGMYACEFNVNPFGLLYPADGNALVCMLFDIIRRLHQQLYFLYRQCWYNTNNSGWRSCVYGREVGGSSWRCNSLQCADETCKQTCNQKCKLHPKCGVKSPLHSFLEDGLNGFLPHHVKFEKGKLECPIKNHTNLPCKTPMGFVDISQMASHRQTGEFLKDALADLCGDSTACLSNLCGLLNCLLPAAPKTLSEMFGFFYHMFDSWDQTAGLQKHRENAFTESVDAAYFKYHYDLTEVKDMFESTEHVNHSQSTPGESSHDSGDLHSLVSFDQSCYNGIRNCGSYIRPMDHDIYGILTAKNKALWLTWVVYLTESFYRLLQELMKTCEQHCGSGKSKCPTTNRASDSAGLSNGPRSLSNNHIDTCPSIVECPNALSTLYNCGLTFDNRHFLNGRFGDKHVAKRTCEDFIAQLNKVCGGASILAKLVNDTIPNYLFTIRAPFIWLNVALWLLSLLYLLHIMVIRLDLLHIKSHLHSPSSHRIAAQSLLAAARVNKLNRVFYLQP